MILTFCYYVLKTAGLQWSHISRISISINCLPSGYSQLPGPCSSGDFLCLTQTRLVSFLLDLHQGSDLSWLLIGQDYVTLHSHWSETDHTEPTEGLTN